MSVYTKRKLVNDALNQALGDQFVVAAGPDHPLLMKAPDVLVGGQGYLTALIIPTVTERKHPKRAIARFALSRMALPEATKFVLIASEEDSEVADLLLNTVSAVIPFKRSGMSELTRIVAQPQQLDQKRVPDRLREKVSARFGEIYRVARVTRRRRARSLASEVWPEAQAISHPASRYLRRNAEIGPMTIEGAEESFVVDNGVPYPTDRTPDLAVIGRLTDYPGDPQKYIRASAFSGWLLSESGNPYVGAGMQILERLVRQ